MDRSYLSSELNFIVLSSISCAQRRLWIFLHRFLNDTHIKGLRLYDISSSPNDTSHNIELHLGSSNSDELIAVARFIRQPSVGEMTFLCDLKMFETLIQLTEDSSSWTAAASSLELRTLHSILRLRTSDPNFFKPLKCRTGDSPLSIGFFLIFDF